MILVSSSTQARAEALLDLPSELIFTERSDIAARALAVRLPTIFSIRPMVTAGGLMSYGTEGQWRFRRFEQPLPFPDWPPAGPSF
jgi:hypothetical protein